MVRNLMWMVGLSLTVAAFGCSSSSDGEDSGACTTEADVAIICDSGFSEAVAACGTGNLMGGPEAIAMCVVDETGLSSECSACFGATTQCTIENCLTDCATDPLSDACTTCRAENCDAAFNECAGEFNCDDGTGGTGGDGAGGDDGSAGAGGDGGAGGDNG